MKNQNEPISFAANLVRLYEQNNFSHSAIQTLWRLSEVHRTQDLVDYYLNDADKWQMAMYQWSSDCDNNKNEMIEAALNYLGSAYTNVRKLQLALERELHLLNSMHKTNKEVEQWLKDLDI